MAHRGRLNVIAHTLGRPYEVILKEFEGERQLEAVTHDPEGGTGDVKYHHGAQGVRTTANGEVHVTLASNPSHLEAVDPVVEGTTRAPRRPRHARSSSTTRPWRSRSSSTGTRPLPARGSSPRRSTCSA